MPHRPETILDELLVLQCQDGVPGALDQLFGRWNDRLLRHAWHLTGRDDAAADVTQESWLAIARTIRRLKDPARFRQWAYRIVTNKCADWTRRVQRQRKLTATLAQSQPVEPTSTLEDSADSERLVELRQAIERLSSEHRAVLNLHYMDDLGISEVADVLRIPPGTVKSRLFHARKQLKDSLEREDHEHVR